MRGARYRPLRIAVLLVVATTSATASFGQDEGPLKVRTTVVGTGTVTRRIEAAGILTPWRQVTVVSKGSGSVIDLRCEVGQRVGQSEILVRLDDELAVAAVSEAKPAAERAKAQVAQSSTDLDRAKTLLESGDISESEWELMSLRQKEASAALATARAQLTRAEKALRDSRVRAPFAATVARRHVELGSWLTPGQPVADLVDLDRMKAEFGIAQQRLPEVREGMVAHMTVDSYPGVDFEARVSRVGVVADRASGQFRIEVSVKQSGANPLRPGMAVRLNLDTEVKQGVVLVPRDAVLERGGEDFVLVLGPNRRVQRRQVVLGSPSDGGRELISGELRAGEVLVTTYKQVLADGQQVEVEGSTSP